MSVSGEFGEVSLAVIDLEDGQNTQVAIKGLKVSHNRLEKICAPTSDGISEHPFRPLWHQTRWEYPGVLAARVA